MTSTPDDNLDEEGAQVGAKIPCCAQDSFMARLYARLRLDHMVGEDNSPGWSLVKTMAVVIVVNLIDRGTRNPDGVTSTFVALLCLHPFLAGGTQVILSILMASLVGTITGTLVAAACYLSPSTDPNGWMILFSLPLSVTLTQYALMFVDRNDPSSRSSGLFSALFVILVQFAYPPLDPIINANDPRRLIWQTLLVRIIALATAFFAAFLVNFGFSSMAPLKIFKTRMYFGERMVLRVSKHNVSPVSDVMQATFKRIVSLIQIGPTVCAAAKSWVFGASTLRQAKQIEKRASALFQFLNLRVFLYMLLDSIPDDHQEERLCVIRVIQQTQRNLRGNALSGCSLEEDLSQIDALPESFYLLRITLREVIQKLYDTKVNYLPPEELRPCWGKV